MRALFFILNCNLTCDLLPVQYRVKMCSAKINDIPLKTRMSCHYDVNVGTPILYMCIDTLHYVCSLNIQFSFYKSLIDANYELIYFNLLEANLYSPSFASKL